MGRKNSKIPGQRMEIQKGLQKEIKQRRKLSIEDQERLRKTVLKYYEVCINSKDDRKKIGEIITQILTECGLDIKDTNNRKKVSKFITQEIERLQRESKKPAKTIRSVILANNDTLFNEYWAAKKLRNNKEREKRIKEIISYILEEAKLKDDIRNRARVVAYMCDEKKRRESKMCETENEEENTNKIGDVIVENEYLITYFTCNKEGKGKIISAILEKSKLKNNYRNRQKVITKINSMKDKSKSKEVVNQSISKIIGEEIQLGNADKKLDKQLNNQPTEEQDTTCNVSKTHDDIIADTNEILPFFWNNDVFDDCENYPEL